MPTAAPHPCAKPGCPRVVPRGVRYCPTHHKTARRAEDTRRGTAASRGYGSRWQRARAAFLAEHPLCVMCEREGRVTAATVVDHIDPHRGDMEKFWDSSQWQSLCASHHNRDKQSLEKGGTPRVAFDVNGNPIGDHHWNRK